ncbi:hypothetical protein ACFX1R_027175 [Malus domestica]
MKDGRHMLLGEGGTASSPRFKSKRRSEGPDIFKGVEESRGQTNKILEVQEGSFYKRKLKCALKRTVCLFKNQHSTGFQRSKRRAQNLKRPIQKSKRQAQKSEGHPAFPDAPTPITRKLSFAEITGNLSKRRSQISKRRQSFPDPSAPITHKLSFAEITGNLSKRRSQISKRCQSFPDTSAPITRKLSFAEITGNLSKRRSQLSKRRRFFFQPCQHLSHAHSAWRKLRTIC